MRVPVLSKITVLQESMRSSMAVFLMMMARLAATEIAPIMATGMASNKGHGVAMTSTARKRVGSLPAIQRITAIASASTVYQAPRRSAILRNCGRFVSASSMTRVILAYRESTGSLSTLIVSAVSPLTAPDNTAAPTTFEI